MSGKYAVFIKKDSLYVSAEGWDGRYRATAHWGGGGRSWSGVQLQASSRENHRAVAAGWCRRREFEKVQGDAAGRGQSWRRCCWWEKNNIFSSLLYKFFLMSKASFSWKNNSFGDFYIKIVWNVLKKGLGKM